MTTTLGDLRSPALKAHDAQVLDRVKRGIELLTREHGPDWVDHIDLKTLDLGNGDRCILGQLYRDTAPEMLDGYDFGVETLDIAVPSDYGFDLTIWDNTGWAELKDVWVDALTPRAEAGA